ncbi:FAD binding domain-containing protein [Fomitopsis betulina]|nr:FAD binding domain-containing protein [Fomitopsis betulina]
MSPVPVLVAGAGPTGLFLALTLLKNGVQVRVVVVNEAQVYRLPRTQEILRFLGALDDVLALALTVKPRCEYKLPGGVEPLNITTIAEIEEPTPMKPYVNGALLGQYNTEAILRKHIEQLGSTVEYGTALTTFEQHPDHVDATLVKKVCDTESTEMVSCRVLVGTDGAKGVVRKQLGLSFLGETRDDRHWILGLVEVQGLGTEYWHQWGNIHPDYLMLIPTEKPGYFSFLLTEDQLDFEQVAADEDALRERFYKHVEWGDLTFGRLEAVSPWRPNIRMVDRFGDGRVFVAGDAAHVHAPAGGQGLNSSAQDSFNLAWKIALVEKGLASPTLLATYNEERLPVIAAMLQKSTILYDSLQKAGSLDFKRGDELRQLGVNCRWGSIVVDERTPKPKSAGEVNPYESGSDGALRAGDRAPQAPVTIGVGANGGAETSLFDIFGPDHHTVLLFNTPADETGGVIDAVKKYPAEGGYAFSAYQVSTERPLIVVVRPDGVVGGIVYGLEGLKTYFGGVFDAVKQ